MCRKNLPIKVSQQSKNTSPELLKWSPSFQNYSRKRLSTHIFYVVHLGSTRVPAIVQNEDIRLGEFLRDTKEEILFLQVRFIIFNLKHSKFNKKYF